MLIRSLDFARHSVVLANEAELAPTPGQPQAPRSELVARVLAVAGGEATLQLGNQRVVVQTHIPLNIGDKLNVRVSDGGEGPDGAPILKLLLLDPSQSAEASPVLIDADLDAMLLDLGVSSDARTRLVARTLLARDGALDRGALVKLLADLRPFPELSARDVGAAALLQKAHVAVTPEAVALVTSRAEPEAPPQLGQRLSALLPALEQLKQQLPPRSPSAAPLENVMRLLAGLPLDDGDDGQAVTRALREWIGRLQPTAPPGTPAQPGQPAGSPAGVLDAAMRLAQRLMPAPSAPPAALALPSDASAPTPAPAPEAAAPETPQALALPSAGKAAVPAPAATPARAMPPAPAAPDPTPSAQPAASPTALAGPTAPSAAQVALAAQAPAALALPTAGKNPSAAPAAETPAPSTSDAKTAPNGKPAAAERAATPPPISQPSHSVAAQVGIRTGSPLPDLAHLLERLESSLNGAEPKLQALLKEAVAEVRYTQLLNAPSPQPAASGQEYLVPLLLPSLHPDHPEGKLQIFHKPGKPGEAADPHNIRLVFILDTEHLGLVQADVNVQDGHIDLAMGVSTSADNALLSRHMGELEAAISALGFTPGRFASRVARKQPPKLPQEEGLTEVKRFDRRV